LIHLRATILLFALAATLAGCATVKIGPHDVLITNDDLARYGWKLSGGPTSKAALEPGRRVGEGAVKAAFGNIHIATIEGRPQGPLIVFCGGNAFREAYAGEERGAVLAHYGDVLMFDYPGFGMTDGQGTKEEFEATRSALAAEINRRAQGGRRIIFWGHSLGGGVCALLALDSKEPATLILEGAFANFGDVLRAKAGILAPFVRLQIDPRTVQYDIPALMRDRPEAVIVVASHADKTIPFSATKRLAARLQAQGRTVKFIALSGAEHSRLFADPQYDPQVRSALSALANGRSGYAAP